MFGRNFFKKPDDDAKALASVSKEYMTLIKVAFCRILDLLF